VIILKHRDFDIINTYLFLFAEYRIGDSTEIW